jgi:hypothetical protein
LRRLVGNGSLPPPTGFWGHALVDYLTQSGRRRLREKKEKGEELARVLTRQSQLQGSSQDAAAVPVEDVEKALGASMRESDGKADKVIEGVAKDKLERQRQSKWKRLNPFQSLIYLLEPDVAVSLGFNALIYGKLLMLWKAENFLTVDEAVFYCATASFSTLLQDIYDLNEIEIGLCFIAGGVGW